MDKELENQKLNYVTQGDYCLPCIRTKEQTELHIGVWANRHRQYLKQHHRIRYYNLLTSEKLYPYLADIEEQAEAMFSRLVKSFAKKENVTEKLKADNPMLWVQKMNNIRNRAMEIVNNEVIYV
ncbi:TnpV protein [bacterium]|nr:TnpV protein [bacterium]